MTGAPRRTLHIHRAAEAPTAPEPAADRLPLTAAVAHVMAAHAANGSAERTAANTAHYLSGFVAFLEARGRVYLEDVSAGDITAYFAALRMRGFSATTVATHAISVRRLFVLAEKNGTLHGPNPWRRVEMPKAQRPIEPAFSEAEVRALIAAAQSSQRSAGRNVALLLVLLDTGARIGEVLALRIRDVDTQSGRVRIEHGKGGKSRTVFLSEMTLGCLRAELTGRRGNPPQAAPLFCSPHNPRAPLRDESVRGLLHRLGERAGVPNVHPHRFRKTFAVTLLRRGADLETVRRLMGHASLVLLSTVYLSLVDDDLLRVHRACSPVSALGLELGPAGTGAERAEVLENGHE